MLDLGRPPSTELQLFRKDVSLHLITQLNIQILRDPED